MKKIRAPHRVVNIVCVDSALILEVIRRHGVVPLFRAICSSYLSPYLIIVDTLMHPVACIAPRVLEPGTAGV